MTFALENCLDCIWVHLFGVDAFWLYALRWQTHQGQPFYTSDTIHLKRAWVWRPASPFARQFSSWIGFPYGLFCFVLFLLYNYNAAIAYKLPLKQRLWCYSRPPDGWLEAPDVRFTDCTEPLCGSSTVGPSFTKYGAVAGIIGGISDQFTSEYIDYGSLHRKHRNLRIELCLGFRKHQVLHYKLAGYHTVGHYTS